jgi:hypothetical protein
MTHVVCPKVIQSLRNLDLLLLVEKGICKLLSFSEGALDDLKAGNIAEEVANGLVRVS